MEPVQRDNREISILCVEDEPIAKAIVHKTLSLQFPAIELHFAENGKAGLELFKELNPDIVLTDIKMPVMDGIQMAKEIRALSSKVDIIVITAYDDTRYLLDAIKIGISRYVLKPINQKVLFEAIEDCLARNTLEKQVKKQNEFISKLSRAVEQSPAMVVIRDADRNIEYVNPKFTEVTGYTLKEAIEQNPQILKTDETPPETHEKLWKTITAGLEWRGEYLNKKKNGDLYWESASISPIFNEEGEITHYVAVKEDVTEKKSIENALHESEAQYHALFENSIDGLILTSPSGSILRANSAACRIFGRTEKGMCLVGLDGIMDASDPRLAAALKVQAGTGMFRGELTAIHGDGTRFPVELSASIYPGANGQNWSSIIVRDISERKRSEGELRKSEERYRLLFNSGSDAVFVHGGPVNGLPGKFIEVNDIACQRLGYTREELMHMSPLDIDAPETIPHIPAIMEKLSTEKSATWAGIHVSKDGRKIPVEINNHLFELEGKPTILSVARDITERKQAEEALRENEEKFRSLVTNMSEGVALHQIVYDDCNKPIDYIITDVNSSFETHTGLTRERAVNKTASVLYGINSAPYLDIYSEVAATGKPTRFDTYFPPLEKHFTISVISLGNGRFASIFLDITEQKRHEKELQQYSDIVTRMQTGLYVYHLDDHNDDRTLRLVAANPASATALGLSEQKLLGRSLDDIFPKLRNYGIPARFADVVRSGISFQMDEFPYGDENVKNAYFSVKVIPLPDECVGVLFEDITKRKQAEIALRESEWLLRESQRVAQLGTYDFDIVNDTWKSSQTLDEIFGVDESYQKNLSGWIAIVHPDYRGQMADYVASLIAQKQRFDKEYKIIRQHDGEERWVAGFGELKSDESGNIVRLIGTIQDITERKRGEEALFKSNKAYRALSVCNEAIARATDEQELLMAVTRIVQEHCRYSMVSIGFAEQNEAKTVRPVAQAGFEDDGYLATLTVSWADNEWGRGPSGTAIRTRKPCIMQNIMTDPDFVPWRDKAIVRGYRSVASLPMGTENEVLGALTVYAPTDNAFTWEEIELLTKLADNLTYGIFSLRVGKAREQAEKVIRRLNEELEERVRERTTQLEATTRELESFSYSVSHDLRAPLRRIISFASILQEECASKCSGNSLHYIDRLKASTQRMNELIDALLKLAKVSKSELKVSMVDLSALAGEICETLREQEPNRQVAFRIAEDIKTKGDPTLLRVVMDNLIGNAWKYSANKEAIIIEFGAIDREGKRTYFVRDNGAGFDMTNADKLFAPFHRLHTDEEFKGIGIGLATVQRVIHRHGGNIWGEGIEGEGAIFYFTLA